MLEDYAEKNGFTGIRHFTNDGISGITFENQKERIRAEDREKGIYRHAGVSNIPRAVSTGQREQARRMMIEQNKAKED